MLNNVAAINNPARTLLQKPESPLKNFFIRNPATAPHEDRNTARGLNNFVVLAHVIGRVTFDDVRAQFHRLPDQMRNLLHVPIHHIPTRLFVGLKTSGSTIMGMLK